MRVQHTTHCLAGRRTVAGGEKEECPGHQCAEGHPCHCHRQKVRVASFDKLDRALDDCVDDGGRDDASLATQTTQRCGRAVED